MAMGLSPPRISDHVRWVLALSSCVSIRAPGKRISIDPQGNLTEGIKTQPK